MTASRDQHLARLANRSTHDSLVAMGFAWNAVDRNVCAASMFKRATDDGIALVGLVGGASSGKSTLFNSLLGFEVSRISAHAHETLGPVVGVWADDARRVRAWADADLLFDETAIQSIQPGDVTTGAVGAIHLCEHKVERLAGVLVADLPDVTSKMSADEGSVTQSLLPLFDGLVVVVDEERWFDATVLDDTIERFRDCGARIWIVFNRTERPEAIESTDAARLETHAHSLHTTGHCICAYVPGSGYRDVGGDTRATLLEWAEAACGVDRLGSLDGVLRRRCAGIVRENVDRAAAHDRLARSVDDELGTLADDSSLSLDLLTAKERSLLGLGHRLVPLYDLVKSLGAKIGWLSGRRVPTDAVDFDKREDTLADVLERNLAMRFNRATDRIDTLIVDSGYVPRSANWSASWSLPSFDSAEWAFRIRAHIDAWKEESARQSRTGDVAALSLSVPLLLADILFLGGAGVTVTWATAWLAGLVGGKGLVRLVQRSKAYDEYRTTVRAYQAFLRESLADQWQANIAEMPRRHMRMTDPVLEALMVWSTPT